MMILAILKDFRTAACGRDKLKKLVDTLAEGVLCGSACQGAVLVIKRSLFRITGLAKWWYCWALIRAFNH